MQPPYIDPYSLKLLQLALSMLKILSSVLKVNNSIQLILITLTVHIPTKSYFAMLQYNTEFNTKRFKTLQVKTLQVKTLQVKTCSCGD